MRPNRKGDKNPMFGKSHSDSTKKLVAESRKNTKWIFEPNTKIQKSIKIEEIDKFLKKGWKLGRPKKEVEPDFLSTY